MALPNPVAADFSSSKTTTTYVPFALPLTVAPILSVLELVVIEVVGFTSVQYDCPITRLPFCLVACVSVHLWSCTPRGNDSFAVINGSSLVGHPLTRASTAAHGTPDHAIVVCQIQSVLNSINTDCPIHMGKVKNDQGCPLLSRPPSARSIRLTPPAAIWFITPIDSAGIGCADVRLLCFPAARHLPCCQIPGLAYVLRLGMADEGRRQLVECFVVGNSQ